MKVVLYNPQSSAGRKPVLPMSLLALGAVLEGEFDYQIVDGNLESNPLRTLEAALNTAGPNAVLGMTVMPGPQLEQAVPLSRALKARRPDTPIVWGGYFPSQHWDACLRADYVDYVVRGHGELAFAQLLRLLSDRRSIGGDPSVGGRGRPTGAENRLVSSTEAALKNLPMPARQEPDSDRSQRLEELPGIACRDASGKPVTNPPAPIPRPKELPSWNLEKVPVERYLRETFLGSRTLGYHSSYGCPFFCNFCAVVTMVNGRWFPQPAETVAEMVHTYHERWGVDAVEFVDNNFFTQEARVAEFSARIMDLGLAWWGEGRIDTMQMYSHETWALMRDAGLKMVFMGAESGSDETLKRMDKGGKMSTERTVEMVRLMKAYDIVPELSFVMGNPPDPEADFRQTAEFIRKIKKINPATEIIMYLYTPVPLSGDLFEQAKSSGFAFPETLEGWISPDWLAFSQRRSTTMPWIGRSLRDQMRDFERVINAYYPTSTDDRLGTTWRKVLRAASAWRYHTRFYHFPLELMALHKVVSYQRPETSGF